jgi:hypothetical protein
VIDFDWSSKSDGEDAPQINWAAFYSDCEHEVFPVTGGHRVTLTYNLFATLGNGHLANIPSALNPQHMPLAHLVAEILDDGDFLPDGRLDSPL